MSDHYDPLQFDHYMKDSRNKIRAEIKSDRKPAALSSRCAAGFIDMVFVGMISGFILPVFGMFVTVVYYILIPGFSYKQATFGQQVLGIRVVTADPLKNTNILHHALRYFLFILSILPLGAGIWMMFFNKERMTFHDWASGTRVVSSKL